MRTLLAPVVVVACLVGLAGCSFSFGGPEAVTRAELEKQVAGLYTADDDTATIEAECDGTLEPEVDATQDCHVSVGEESADVHLVVTEVGDSEVEFESTPYIPAERVAETIMTSLGDQGYDIESVECEDELVGVLESTTTCTATPAEGDGTVEAKVTSVDGLMVNFNYEVVS